MLHDTSSASAKRACTNAVGLVGGVVSAPRTNKSTRPNAHGAINNTKYTDGTGVTLTLEVTGTSIEDAFAQFEAISAVCVQTLDYGPALLKWTEGTTGRQLQRLVKLDGPIDPPIQNDAAMLTFQVQFFAEDPRAYSQAATTVTSSAVTSLVGNATFAGDTVGNPPAGWSTTSGTFSTASVVAGGWGTWTKTLKLAATLTNTTAIFGCTSFACAPNTAYAAAVMFEGTLPLLGDLIFDVNFYDSGGVLLGHVGYLDEIAGTGAALGVTILAGSVVSPPSAATAQVVIRYLATSASALTFTGQFAAVTFTPVSSVTITNNGERDTPADIAVTFPAGFVTVASGSSLNIALTNTRWVLSPPAIGTDVLTVDLGNREVSAQFEGNLLSSLVAASGVWGNLPSGNSTVTALGLLIGSTLSVTLRDAY